jgi:hypothetical protein
MSDTPNPNVFFRGDDMGIGNFPIKGGKISNQPINDGGYWFEKFKEANERIKRLEEALAWYESTVSDCNRHGPEGDVARDALAKDQGRKAKEAKP